MPTDPSRVSEIRDFRPGGLHPANRGDVLNGRYKICFPHSAAWSGESFTYVVKVQECVPSLFRCAIVKLMTAVVPQCSAV